MVSFTLEKILALLVCGVRCARLLDAENIIWAYEGSDPIKSWPQENGWNAGMHYAQVTGTSNVITRSRSGVRMEVFPQRQTPNICNPCELSTGIHQNM